MGARLSRPVYNLEHLKRHPAVSLLRELQQPQLEHYVKHLQWLINGFVAHQKAEKSDEDCRADEHHCAQHDLIAERSLVTPTSPSITWCPITTSSASWQSKRSESWLVVALPGRRGGTIERRRKWRRPPSQGCHLTIRTTSLWRGRGGRSWARDSSPCQRLSLGWRRNKFSTFFFSNLLTNSVHFFSLAFHTL